MKQTYKTVYFTDIPADLSNQKSLTLGFGKKSADVFEQVKDLSSEEIRQVLGTDSFSSLVRCAEKEDLPVNTYCVRELRRSLKNSYDASKQMSFSGMISNDIFNPVSVTFKGGAKEPFVRWYPYLQGYSPDFVKAILAKYAPNAKTILDPFAGNGTTAFTAAVMGIRSYFCEINPVLQHISQTKIKIRQITRKERNLVVEAIPNIRKELQNIDKYPSDLRLQVSYMRCFGNSKFFDQSTYEKILKIRTWIDEISLKNPLLAQLLTVALLASLVPSSKMKRVGDLRYKTKLEEKKSSPSLLSVVDSYLLQIQQDIESYINGFHNEPILITENANSLSKIPSLGIDTIITSPPYVNGTNYFRNTKIELWFLRCLVENDDLFKFRSEALTAGINDVSNGKITNVVHPDVQNIVKQLEKNAYDVRIPKMIASYFSEITEIFSGIRSHLLSNSTIAIDIGDSCYGGVHVPVDKLLSSCFVDLGYSEYDQIDLRKRRSKGGAVLKQTLLVYKYNPINSKINRQLFSPTWKIKWNEFKSHLPHQHLPYSKRNWGNSLHSLCSYSGKLKPSIAHYLVDIFVPPGGKLLDPFAGVGTIPFEGSLQGKHTYGFEISPAAYFIANAKLHHHTNEGCDYVIEKLESFITSNIPTDDEINECKSFGFNGKISEYYHTKTLNEIILARRFFKLNPPESDNAVFVFASLLHILHGNRPYALSRNSHPLTPYKPTGITEYKSLIPLLDTKVKRGLLENLPTEFQTGKVFFQDATTWWPREVDKLDAIITSPPFFDSTRFCLSNWIRLWFCGWDHHDFSDRPSGFVDELQKHSFEIYNSIFRQARERLQDNGVVIMHLGKSVKCDMAEELQKIGKKWFRAYDILQENVEHCESHGIRDKGTVTSHQYLVLY
jgi:tRNA G10  N-methylase Trm11